MPKNTKNFGNRRGPPGPGLGVGPGPPVHDKRPSVFERLGVRSTARYSPEPLMPIDRIDPPRWPGGEPSGHFRDARIRHGHGPPPDIVKRRSPSFSPSPRNSKNDGKGHPSSSSGIPTRRAEGRKEKDKHGSSAQKREKKKEKRESGEIGKKKKERVSSGSSGAISTDSSSTSRSTSTSSTSSSGASSSSDSSVPSIKLSSSGKERTKKTKTTERTKRHTGHPASPISSNSGGIPVDGQKGRGPSSRVQSDLREKLNARSPSGKGLPGRSREEEFLVSPRHPRGESPIPRKRIHPDPYFNETIKRRRVSPPPIEKYRDEPQQFARRAPPQSEPMLKHGRSRSPTFQRERDPYLNRAMLSPSPGPGRREPIRRPPDARMDRDSRVSPYPPREEFDIRRESNAGPMRDNRSKERFPPGRGMLPDSRLDRDRNERGSDRGHRRPPFGSHVMPEQGRRSGSNAIPERERPRPLFEEKREPLIPKSKEALAERYEQMRKSGYVDRWVDETVNRVTNVRRPESEGNRSPIISTPSSKSAFSPPPKTEETIGSGTVKTRTSEKLVPDDLSDFSDDADDLLNTIDESTGDQEAETSPPIKDVEIEKERTKEVPISSRIRSTSVDTGTSSVRQDRPTAPVARPREKTSLPSQSQTDDDILEGMDFEEISEDELIEENRVKIVDALGVDWASLVCQEKKSISQNSDVESKSSSARKRWKPANFILSVSNGLAKQFLSESLYNRVKEAQDPDKSLDEGKRQVDDVTVLEKIGLGPNSRALSSRRDMAVRRHFLGLPPKSLLDMDIFHTDGANSTSQEMDTTGELLKMSISVLSTKAEASAVSA